MTRHCIQATAPQNVRGTVLQYSSEQLLVHLDDQDEDMQRAVFQVLEVRFFLSFIISYTYTRYMRYCYELMGLLIFHGAKK